MIQLNIKRLWLNFLLQSDEIGEKENVIDAIKVFLCIRYKDIVPFDSNRVIVHPPYTIPGDSHQSDYINASFISDVMLGTPRKYIAAQVSYLKFSQIL